MLARHFSDLTGPSSGAFFLQALCAGLVCGNTRIILCMPPFGGEVKESVPCPSFAAFKRT